MTVFRQWLEYKYNGSLTPLRIALRRSCAPVITDVHVLFLYINTVVLHLSLHYITCVPANPPATMQVMIEVEFRTT